MNDSKSRFYSLDALKGICALLVVLFHVPLPEKLGDVVILFAKSAVPIFFIISGYFIGSKKDQTQYLITIPRQITKILKLALTSCMLYLLFGLLIYHDDLINFISTYFSSTNIKRWLLLNEPYYGGHLWYLFAYIYTLILLFIIIKYKAEKVLPILTFLGLVSYYVFGKYSMLLFRTEFDYIYIRNFFVYGLPYVSIGFYLANKDISRWTNKKTVPLIALSVILLLFEYGLLNYLKVNTVSNNYIGNMFLSFFVVIFCINNKNIAKDSLLYRLGNRNSLYIYIIHPMINSVYSFLFTKLGFSSLYTNIKGIIVLFTSIIVSVIYWNFKKFYYTKKGQ